MQDKVTKNEVVSIGRSVRLEIGDNESEMIAAHLDKQLSSFECLKDINTDDVTPMLGMFGGSDE